MASPFRKRLIHYIEPTNDVWVGLSDADPRTAAGIVAGIGSFVTDEAGNQYRKTGSGATAWTLIGDTSTTPMHGTGAPTSGGAGTGVGTAAPGRVYVDDSTGQQYANVGTLNAPQWAAIQMLEVGS